MARARLLPIVTPFPSHIAPPPPLLLLQAAPKRRGPDGHDASPGGSSPRSAGRRSPSGPPFSRLPSFSTEAPAGVVADGIDADGRQSVQSGAATAAAAAAAAARRHQAVLETKDKAIKALRTKADALEKALTDAKHQVSLASAGEAMNALQAVIKARDATVASLTDEVRSLTNVNRGLVKQVCVWGGEGGVCVASGSGVVLDHARCSTLPPGRSRRRPPRRGLHPRASSPCSLS